MAQHREQAVVSCQMCEQTSQIKMKCLDCEYLLCASCCQLHKKVKDLSNHQLVGLHDIGLVKEKRRTKINCNNIKCRRHAEHKCCLFCEDCDKVVCAICISETHNQHKMIQMSEGRKLYADKIITWRTDIEKKIKTLTTDMSTLDNKYSTENSKYCTEMEKILSRDKVLKDAVDSHTKTLVHDLDRRWNRIKESVKDEISHADKYKQHLQSKEEELKQALESNNADDVFRTVEEEQKQGIDLDRPVNLKHEILPTFKSKEINLSVINSLHGSLRQDKTDVKNIKINAVECYKTDAVELNCIQCNADGTIWINHFTEETLACVEKHDNRTLKATKKFEIRMLNMAVTPHGDLLLSVGNSNLLMIPHKQQTIKKSQCSVSPLVTTAAIHVSQNKIIVGAKEQGPLYSSSGPRKIIVMDMQGKTEKEYEFDSNKRPLFTNPRRVTMDRMNNLYVLNRKYPGLSGQVITINCHAGKIKVYNGHPNINNQDHPFTPGDLVATESDNIVVSDRDNNLLHILNSDGECMKYINTAEHGIKCPWSLDIDKEDLLHIGCYKKETIKKTIGLISRAKLHVVKFDGF